MLDIMCISGVVEDFYMSNEDPKKSFKPSMG